jgi:hypothetical protein
MRQGIWPDDAEPDRRDVRSSFFKLLFWASLPFGYLQADLAGLYRACARARREWLPLTALAAPLILVGWTLSRGIYRASYRGLLALAPEPS